MQNYYILCVNIFEINYYYQFKIIYGLDRTIVGDENFWLTNAGNKSLIFKQDDMYTRGMRNIQDNMKNVHLNSPGKLVRMSE